MREKRLKVTGFKIVVRQRGAAGSTREQVRKSRLHGVETGQFKTKT